VVIKMVMRSLEIKKLRFDRLDRSEEEIMAKIRKIFGDTLKVTITEKDIIVEGDLHDHRKRKPLLDYLAGD